MVGYQTVLTEENTRQPANVNVGANAVGKSTLVSCDVCFVTPGESCHDEQGRKIPSHVSRARAARWSEMLRLP